jgi:hypothetical protein
MYQMFCNENELDIHCTYIIIFNLYIYSNSQFKGLPYTTGI